MENKNSKGKILSIILMIFIALLIIVNFILYNEQFAITREILVCLSLLVILCLADSFDNLSISKLISLSRNMNKGTDNLYIII